jgi:hypothetical protein
VTDTRNEAAALARIIASRTRHVERELREIRRLAARLRDTVGHVDTTPEEENTAS